VSTDDNSPPSASPCDPGTDLVDAPAPSNVNTCAPPIAELLLLVLLGVIFARLSYWWGMHQFGGMDHSAIIDVGWRLFCGQKPYTDFPCTFPVGFYLGAELAFRLFGVFWKSIIKFNVLYFLLTYFWLYAVFRVHFRRGYLPLLLALACECLTLIRNSYWWYNSVTSITAILYFASVAAVLLRPRSRPLWLSLCLSLFLLALMKPNASAPLIVGGTIALLMDRHTRKHVLTVSIIAFALWFGTIAIHHSTIRQVLGSYLSVASYAFSMNHPGCPSNVPTRIDWVCAILAVVGFPLPLFLGKRIHFEPPLSILILAALIAGAMAFYSNSEPRLDALSLVFVASLLFSTRFGDLTGAGSAHTFLKSILPLSAIGCLFVTMSLREAVTRERVRTIGPSRFFENKIDDTPIQDGFFEGLYTGHNLKTCISSIRTLLNSVGHRPIFFGNRVQWAYAAFGLPDHVGLPIVWEPGVTFAFSDEPMLTQRWLDARFDLLVIFEFKFFDQKIIDRARRAYEYEGPVMMHSDPGANIGPLLVFVRVR